MPFRNGRARADGTRRTRVARARGPDFISRERFFLTKSEVGAIHIPIGEIVSGASWPGREIHGRSIPGSITTLARVGGRGNFSNFFGRKLLKSPDSERKESKGKPFRFLLFEFACIGFGRIRVLVEPLSATALALDEHPTRLLMDGRIAGGDDPAAGRGRLAVPGRHHPARPLDDRDKGDDVVRLDRGLDDEVDEAGRERAISVAVAAVAGQPDLVFDPVVGGPVRSWISSGLVVRSVASAREAQARVCRVRVVHSGAANCRARAPKCASWRACRRHRTARG